MYTDLNSIAFGSRLLYLHAQASSVWERVDAICILCGKNNDATARDVSRTLRLHLFGGKIFKDTVLVLTKQGVIFLLTPADDTVQNDTAQLWMKPQSANRGIQLEALEREKGQLPELVQKLITGIKAAQTDGQTPRLGVFFPMKASKGAVVSAWRSALKENHVKVLAITPDMGYPTSVKDVDGLDSTQEAANFSDEVMDLIVKQMQIETGSQLTHAQLVSDILHYVKADLRVQNLKVGMESSCCLTIQSGGTYDCKLSNVGDTNTLQENLIICSLGVCYQGCWAHMSRTILIDPPKKVRDTYTVLLNVFKNCVKVLRPGQQAKEVVKAALTYLEQSRPRLLDFLPESLGYGLGSHIWQNLFTISAETEASFEANMVIHLSVGFLKVPLSYEEREGTSFQMTEFSMLIADTFTIKEGGGPSAKDNFGDKKWSDITYSQKQALDYSARVRLASDSESRKCLINLLAEGERKRPLTRSEAGKSIAVATIMQLRAERRLSAPPQLVAADASAPGVGPEGTIPMEFSVKLRGLRGTPPKFNTKLPTMWDTFCDQLFRQLAPTKSWDGIKRAGLAIKFPTGWTTGNNPVTDQAQWEPIYQKLLRRSGRTTQTQITIIQWGPAFRTFKLRQAMRLFKLRKDILVENDSMFPQSLHHDSVGCWEEAVFTASLHRLCETLQENMHYGNLRGQNEAFVRQHCIDPFAAAARRILVDPGSGLNYWPEEEVKQRCAQGSVDYGWGFKYGYLGEGWEVKPATALNNAHLGQLLSEMAGICERNEELLVVGCTDEQELLGAYRKVSATGVLTNGLCWRFVKRMLVGTGGQYQLYQSSEVQLDITANMELKTIEERVEPLLARLCAALWADLHVCQAMQNRSSLLG